MAIKISITILYSIFPIVLGIEGYKAVYYYIVRNSKITSQCFILLVFISYKV